MGVNVNMKTLQRRTTLHCASEANDPEIVWFLVIGAQLPMAGLGSIVIVKY